MPPPPPPASSPNHTAGHDHPHTHVCMEKRALRACAACRLRKVKCNGQQPCAQCNHLNIACVFRALGEKRRVRPVRGRLISQLRSGQAAALADPGSSNPVAAETSSSPSEATDTSSQGRGRGRGPPSGPPPPPPPPPPATQEPSPADSPAAALFAPLSLNEMYFIGLISSWETYAFPVNPIVSSAEIVESIQLMREDPNHAAFVYSFAAATVNLTEVPSTPVFNDIVKARIKELAARAVEAQYEAERRDPSRIDTAPAVTVRRIMIPIFLEICAVACKQYETAYLYVNEAIGFMLLLRVERQSPRMDPIELARRQRLYWEIWLHERFISIVSGTPSTMQPLETGLPYPDPTIPIHVHDGFNRIIKLFLIMDSEFISYWHSQDLPESQQPRMTAEWIERKHTELDNDESEMAAACKDNEEDKTGALALTPLQRADIVITRMWMRVMVWQLGMSRCLLSSVPPASSHEAMSLVFPARRLGHQLRSLVVEIDPLAHIGTHGVGMLRKLFEITNTIADVLAMVPDATSRQTIDDFLVLVCVLFSFGRIDTIQRDILRMKIQKMNDMFHNFHLEGMFQSRMIQIKSLM